jgi:flagellar hook-length control protein FliK
VPVVASGPVTVATASAPTELGETLPVRSVAAQVIPEITRLVSDGEGVHRVTLQLNPRALGEVRVVLTMRQGEVHVRIAGGEEARQAVAASSAELSRALHHVGIEEHRLTLTELPAAPTPARGSVGSELHDQTRQHHTTGGNDPDPHGQNSHSRMGDARSATDGSSTSNPTDRSRGSARVHEVSRARTTGEVDLRM